MALSITVTRAIPLFPGGAFIQWDLLNPTESGTYLFSVYRGTGANGPWEQLVSNAANIMSYVDKLSTLQTATMAVNQLSLSRNWVYRVTAIPPSGVGGQVEVISDIEPKLTGRPRLLKRKMLRDEALMLRKINGVEVAVLKRMHWGARCTKCFDKYSKEVVRGNCTACYGTGYSPGYHDPVVTLARRSVGPVQTAITPQGKQDVAQNQITMLDAPTVEENDILVFLRDNTRFVVKQQMVTELLTVTVHQKLLVSELARSSIEYRIPCDPLRVPPLF